MIVKNIEKRIQINKTMAIATVIFAIVIVIVGFTSTRLCKTRAALSIYLITVYQYW